jgi:hypothetical protein
VEFRDRVDAHRAVILLAPMEGEMRFIALTARLDVRYDARNGGPVSPEGDDQAFSANRGEFFNHLLNRPPWKEHRRLRRVYRSTDRPLPRRHARIRPPSVPRRQNLLARRSLGLSLRAGRSDDGHLSSSASAPCCSSTISSLIG